MTTSGFELVKVSTYLLIDAAILVMAWAHLYAYRNSKYGGKEIISMLLMVVGISFLVLDIKNLRLLLQ